MYLVVLLTLLCASNRGLACSAFELKGDGYQFIGFNENWKYMPGMVVVNKRGLDKDYLGWADLVADQPSGSRLHWISKWGSVTFSAMGIDLPCYGLNEAGLFVVELALDDTHSLPDHTRPNMFWPQWIQYQLDNFSTVEELVANLPQTPVIDWWPKFTGSHFFVADAHGDTAAVEIIKGKLVVSTGERMKIPALCNGPYQDELANLGRYKPFGGDKIFDLSSKFSWNTRFVRLVHRLTDYHAETNSPAPMQFAWNLLDEARAGVWQLVADVPNRTLYFRTEACPSIKSIDLRQCDFTTRSPIRFADIHLNFTGDITSRLMAWTPEINQAYVLPGFPASYEQEDFYRSLEFPSLVRNLKKRADGLQRQIQINPTSE